MKADDSMTGVCVVRPRCPVPLERLLQTVERFLVGRYALKFDRPELSFSAAYWEGLEPDRSHP